MKNNNNDDKLLKFFGKLAIGVVAGAVLTPLGAVVVGGYTYGAAKCMEQISEKEEDKQTFQFLSDCGRDVSFGGLIDYVVGTEAVSLVSHKTKSIGREASKEIAQHGMTEVAKELIETGREISELQRKIKIINNIKNASSVFLDPIKHKKHLDKNINYLKDCEVCNA